MNGCCQRCGIPLKLKPSEARSEFEIAHAHEINFRSACGDPTDSRNIVILCLRCHLNGIHKQTSKQTEWFVIAILNDDLGADDPDGIEFRPWRSKNGGLHGERATEG